MTGKENQHYAKQQLNGNMTDSLCLNSKCLSALIQSLKNRIFYLFSNTQLDLHVYNLLGIFTCVHNLNRGL